MPNEGADGFDEKRLLPDLDVLWKIATPEEANEWRRSGVVSLASPLDRADGFMHLSNSHRVRKTADLYFKGRGDLRLLKIEAKKLTANDTRSVVFADEAPTETCSREEEEEEDALIYVHYLLVEGKACCTHAYANFASHPLKYEDVVSEVHDMPWNEREGKHEFPASIG